MEEFRANHHPDIPSILEDFTLLRVQSGSESSSSNVSPTGSPDRKQSTSGSSLSRQTSISQPGLAGLLGRFGPRGKRNVALSRDPSRGSPPGISDEPKEDQIENKVYVPSETEKELERLKHLKLVKLDYLNTSFFKVF